MDTTQVGLPQVAPGVVGLYGVPQFAPQGFFGSILGGPVGGFLGSNIGNLLGNPTLGRQIGQTAGTIGGGFLPFTADPTAAAYAQQAQAAQFVPQGFFGNLLGQVGQPLGGVIGGQFGNQGLGSQIGGAIGQLGRLLPFQASPVMPLMPLPPMYQ